ncbi:ABC transporter substrate-binding protein [Bosea sp. BK604]|uniref:ABC transporter substrate-binding protein n=1 Tax=Bosea sp. BK604 TaxID=2512180 RepID=UPI00104E0D43|nr:ABC transporter substrate-binding protein [Bosea sp. BK604]TCR64043.1 multiple sugar transport system substrate-binding protein [Bosea sp. BK604]
MDRNRRSSLLKLAALALASVVSLPVLAQAQQREVRWGQWKGTEVGEKFMAEFKAAFEKDHPDIKLVPVDSPFTGFHDRAVVLHQAKKLPDVLLVQVDWVAEFADLGMIEPIDERIAKEPKEFFANIPVTFHQQWKGKQYYLPIESGAVALFWNTDLFKAAGLSSAPKTWDEFAEYSRKLTVPDKRQFAVTGTLQGEPPTNMTYDIYPLLLQNGAKLIDTSTNKAVFNSPEGVAAIEWYADRINKDKISVPGVLSNGEKEKRANFASGNVAMMFEGPWGIAIQKQLNPKLNYDIAPLPVGKTSGTMVRGSLNTLTSQAQDKEAAWTFMKWMSGPKGIELWSKGTGGFPARTDVSSQDWFKELKLFQAFVTQMGRDNAQSPFLVMPNAVQMNKVMSTEVQNVIQGKKSAKQALDDAAAEWNKVLASAK